MRMNPIRAEYIDHMGDDMRVADAARVSMSKTSDQYTKQQNEKLIKYLASHNHWTPFSHCMVTLRERVPLFVARQRFKHVVGFTYNEISRRYVSDEPEFYRPDYWRARAANVKQGSSQDDLIETEATKAIDGWHRDALEYYRSLLDDGVCPEQARAVLPQSMFTEYYVTGSLAAWARAYTLRSSSDAQAEIRQLADQWDWIIRPLFPVSWQELIHNV